MIKLKEQQLSFIERNFSNNLNSLMEKKILEVENITNNQKFVIANANDFYNKIKQEYTSKENKYKKKQLAHFVFVCILFFSSYLAINFGLSQIYVSCFFNISLIPFIVFISTDFYDSLWAAKIKNYTNLFDNKYEPISIAQIYYIQNKKISENDLNKPNFWQPMNIEELFNWFEDNKT